MELSVNIAIAAGILVEILLLWETSDQQKSAHPEPGILSPRLSHMQEIIALVMVGSWLLIAIAEFWNPTLSLGVLGAIQGSIMFVSFSFLFVFGMVVPKLLPRVNEQTIVVITAIVTVSLVRWGELDWYMWPALLIPFVGIALMALMTVSIPPALKSLLYFWYLVCLFSMAYQSNYEMFSRPSSELRLTSLDYFIGGAAGIFLLLHSIFLVRFFLMLTANLLPQNRYLIGLAMPQLFGDEQMPRYKFIVILLLVAVVILLNRQLGFMPNLSLASLLILFAVHFMDRASQIVPRIL
jgi:hypothetical protein